MDILTFMSVAGVAFFVGIVVGGLIVRWFDGVGEEIEYLRNKEEALKELEARIAEKQGENPDDERLEETKTSLENEDDRISSEFSYIKGSVKAAQESWRK